MKYLIVKDFEDKEHALVFPRGVVHAEVARLHRVSSLRVVSAGFCQLHPVPRTWGQSESLRMSSRPEDQAILQRDFPAVPPPQKDSE